MKIIKINILSLQQKQEVYKLWNNEYPINISYSAFEAFEHYLQSLTEQNHLLLLDENEIVKGWYADFIRENEKWFAMMLDSNFQGKGFGSQLLNEVRKTTTDLNGWVIDQDNYKKKNGEPYKSPLKFYVKNNFKVVPEIRLELDHISAVKIKWTK